ncbi:hypothetical protein KY342_06565 [Candidatus Woesearchaeota archaeon]|nr:hypothetical protein [Candidatus Woesearchaeota archaeon]
MGIRNIIRKGVKTLVYLLPPVVPGPIVEKIAPLKHRDDDVGYIPYYITTGISEMITGGLYGFLAQPEPSDLGGLIAGFGVLEGSLRTLIIMLYGGLTWREFGIDPFRDYAFSNPLIEAPSRGIEYVVKKCQKKQI